MIHEKPLQKKAVMYAAGVVHALTSGGPRPARWSEVRGLIEAAYFNGFQSGVVWQKAASRIVTKYRIVEKDGKVIIANYESKERAERRCKGLTKIVKRPLRVEAYEAEYRTMVRVARKR